MKKIYLLSGFFLACNLSKINAQCPTASGMVATQVSLNGSCFINVQFAIPNSNVSVYNASGFVAQGMASASGAVFIPYPCTANPITSIVSLVTNPTIQSCNTFTLTLPAVLPVKLSAFSVIQTAEKTAFIKWETEFELDHDRFELQKSLDGVNFSTIYSVQSTANTFSKKTYSFDDRSFVSGSTAFYRIKQVDNDGKISYSKVAFISDRASANGDFSVFPNPYRPASGTLQIKGVAASEINRGVIRINDISGKPVSYSLIGANSIQISPAAPAGLYFVTIQGKTVRLSIQQ